MLLIVACSHSFAKVTAIVWPLQLARDEKIQCIIVKVDSKIYVDALKKILEARWEIQPLLYDASVLANSFIGFCFCWIKKDGNSIAHKLSMYILYSNISYYWNCVSFPLAIVEAWERDLSLLLIYVVGGVNL